MAGELITFLIGMVGVSVGGIITFIVNRKLQNRIWNHERARDIYAPILTQLGQAEDSDLNQLKHKFWYSKWDKLRKNPLFYWIKPDIKKKLFSFQVNLHNFNGGLTSSIYKIKEQIKDEILKRIKAEKIDQLQRTKPLVSEYFWDELAKIVLQSDEIGFLGGISMYLKIKQDYEGLGKDFKKKMPFHDFVKSDASRFKDDPLLKQVKGEQKKLLIECQKLQKEIKKEMGIKEKDWG